MPHKPKMTFIHSGPGIDAYQKPITPVITTENVNNERGENRSANQPLGT